MCEFYKISRILKKILNSLEWHQSARHSIFWMINSQLIKTKVSGVVHLVTVKMNKHYKIQKFFFTLWSQILKLYVRYKFSPWGMHSVVFLTSYGNLGKHHQSYFLIVYLLAFLFLLSLRTSDRAWKAFIHVTYFILLGICLSWQFWSQLLCNLS